MSKSRETFYLSPEKQIWPKPEGSSLDKSAVPETAEQLPARSVASVRAASMGAASERSAALEQLLHGHRDLGSDLTQTSPASRFTAEQLPPALDTEQEFVMGEESLGDQPQPDPSSSGGELHDFLNQLARLVANVTESYTAAVFLANPQEKVLELAALHTLSRDIVYQARIGYGCGLIGWTAENAVRISVCPFEHDATTLMYYHRDQGLKSFIAVPILDRQNNLLGVISCDSKKSYAFAKITEKILLDCAVQAATLLTLHQRAATAPERALAPDDVVLNQFLEELRTQRSEKALLELAANLPLDFVARDALVVITTDEPGSSASAFYSAANQVRVGHRLLELVCRHKKVICSERSVQAQTTDDSRQRSFLSIPFHIQKREAGSINLLSQAFEAFSAVEISTLEKVAKTLGKELELIRLREKLVSPEAATGLSSWPQFAIQARAALQGAAAKNAKQGVTLLRIVLTNLHEIEDFLGVAAAHSALLKFMRLVEQAKGSSGLACYLYGYQILLLCDRVEAERIWGRLSRLIDRISLTEENAFESAMRSKSDRKTDRTTRQPGAKLSELIVKGLLQVHVTAPHDGDSLEELVAKSNRLLELSGMETSQQSKQLEEIAHASNW